MHFPRPLLIHRARPTYRGPYLLISRVKQKASLPIDIHGFPDIKPFFRGTGLSAYRRRSPSRERENRGRGESRKERERERDRRGIISRAPSPLLTVNHRNRSAANPCQALGRFALFRRFVSAGLHMKFLAPRPVSSILLPNGTKRAGKGDRTKAERASRAAARGDPRAERFLLVRR